MTDVNLIIVLGQKEVDELHNEGSIRFWDGSCITYTLRGYTYYLENDDQGTSCQIRIRKEQA